MGSCFCVCSSLILLFSLWMTLISPAHSTDCSSLKLPGGKKLYSNCTQLPTLNSTLHFTYNATNSSLSIAFTAAPPNSNGWIAWAVNPTAKGMAGSQALLAFKNNSHVVVKTYNISSYSSIVEGKLSFDVWDLEAGSSSDGKIVIYGSLKVPKGAGSVNQVWQVGPGFFNGHPKKHEFAPANLAATEELNFVEKAGSGSPSSAPAPAPQTGNNDSGDAWMVKKINAALWVLGSLSLLVLM